MSNAQNEPSVREEVFDEVMDTEEESRPQRREHAKADPRPDDDDFERKADIERSEVGLPENSSGDED
jgi:hypothetical protein